MTASSTDVGTRPTTLRYLPGLDGLRAISVLGVIFFHHYFVYGSERGWLPGGFLGVEVFFVVSGYLITSLLLTERRESGRVSFKQFWLRRGRRLLPALWLLLGAVVAYSLLFLPDSIETLKGDVIAALTYTSNWWQIISHRSYAAQAGRPELLKHLWSLAIEEQFYLFWPPVLMLGLRKLGRQRMLTAIVLTAALSTVLLAVTSLQSVNFAYYSTFTRLSGLLLGSAMAFMFAPYRIKRLPGHGARLALDLVGAGGLALLLILFRVYTFPPANTGHFDRSVFFGGFLLVDIATLFVIAAAVHPASDVGRLIGCRPLRWIGVRSYSLYLWHYPIFCVTRPRVDFKSINSNSYFSWLDWATHGWPILVLRLVLTFGAAELSYRFVETPIRHGAIGRYRRRLRESHGATRRVLARRGLVIAGSLILVGVVLGAGLASAQPQTTHFDPNQNGAAPDPNVLAQLRGSNPDPKNHATTTTVAHDGKKGGKAHRTTTTTTVPKPPPHVLAVGDSVMQGAKNALQRTIPDIAVDAVTSRQFGEAVGVVGFYKQYNLLGPILVVHLGTNGTVTDGAIDQIMSLTQNVKHVYFLTARVPRVWEGEVNDTLHRGAQRFPGKLEVLEWRDYAGCHDDWFRDGFHLTDVGQDNYAHFILSGIEGHPLTKCVK
ncbi:MAG TPA: acyltransferase family protein [Acidimicrobiia bacterium]|nr:acyltransferase family protein [Acidimicrobiia bacterium]